MSDSNNNIGKVTKKLGVFKAGQLFLTGLGLCFLFAYPCISYVLKENDERFKKELNSLQSLVKEDKYVTVDDILKARGGTHNKH
jgi:hypothetical protein